MLTATRIKQRGHSLTDHEMPTPIVTAVRSAIQTVAFAVRLDARSCELSFLRSAQRN
jgi:hypothetical protein